MQLTKGQRPVGSELESLIEHWCDRRDYALLARVLPACCEINGLTDGWEQLCAALKSAYGASRGRVSADESDAIKSLFVELDLALRSR